MWVRVSVVTAAAWATACYRPSAQEGLPCSEPSHTCPGDQVCDLQQSPPICTDPGAGTDAAPDQAGGECSTSSDCPGNAPVCETSVGVCRGCEADLECASGVCHELAGTCVDESKALFVTPSGVDNQSCTKLAPCGSVRTALFVITPARRTIRVDDGTYTQNYTIKSNNGGPVVISGIDRSPAGAVFQTGGADLQTDPGSTAVIEGITIAKAGNIGLINRGTTTLSRVRVTEAGFVGIDNRGGSLILLDSQVDATQGIGIESNNVLEVQRSEVFDNRDGGISASGGFTIVNTVIHNNGALSSAVGGAKLGANAGKPAVFRFNTVAGNKAGPNGSAVQCDSAFAVEDSLLVGNLSLLGPLTMSCAPRFCLFDTSPPAGTGNLQGDPMFVSITDFHVLPSSPAVDKADPAATEISALDGGRRPTGAARDIGADEQP
ncbi:hypothetical protein BH11MYX3_BH11MYX3_38360 [soil metagenome]